MIKKPHGGRRAAFRTIRSSYLQLLRNPRGKKNIHDLPGGEKEFCSGIMNMWRYGGK